MDWLPKHKCELILQHNAHRNYYESVEKYVEDLDEAIDDFVSLDDYKKACESDELWELQWYPETPVGFCRVLASSIEVLKKAVQESE